MSRDIDHLETALGRFVEGEARPCDAAQIEAALRDDPAARALFLDYVWAHAMLAGEVLAQKKPQPAPRPSPRRFPRRVAIDAVAAAVVLTFTAMMSILISAGRTPQARPFGPSVATLVDTSADARWEAGDLPTSAGSQLRGGFLRLRSGSATVEFYSGARVTLTGPAEFGLNSTMRGFLRHGTLTAYCPPSAHGFTIGAPGLAVTDLGTEFKLNVNEAGASSLRVLTGTVAISRDSDPGHELARLSANQAMRFEPDRGVLESIPAEPRDLSVADLLRGGDGEGGDVVVGRSFYLEPDTGAVGNQPRMGVIPGDDRYHRAAGPGFVDGVFIPRGGHGPVVLDSAGHTFAGFSPTNYFSFANIAVMPDGGVYVHANKGVTLDLAALREHHHGTITRFSAAIGRSMFRLAKPRSYPIDVWVFVDGTPRFKVLKMAMVDANADVSIGPADRFLTLVVTDAEGNHGNAAVVLKNARLSLTPDDPIRPGSGSKEN